MGRAPCCDEAGLKKGPWTPEEDQKLIDYIHLHGHTSWRSLPKLAGLNRCGKSCRLRWTNYLRPDIKRGKFSLEEEEIIISLHSYLGNKWSAIATHLPGRTDNEIKNFWNTHLKKKLLHRGIDPMTHKPRTDLNFLSSLPHLLAANFGNLMNPWDNALRLQTDVAQLARIQLIQSLLQVITSNAPSNMEAVNHMASASIRDYQLNGFLQSNPRLEGLVDGSLGLVHDLTAVSSGFPDLGIPELVDNYPALAESSFCSEGQEAAQAIDMPGSKSINNDTFNKNNNNYDNINQVASSYAIPSSTPTLVPTSPKKFTMCQIRDQINPTDISTHSSTSTTFEAWGELNLDDQTSDYCWTDMLDQTSSPSWPIPL